MQKASNATRRAGDARAARTTITPQNHRVSKHVGMQSWVSGINKPVAGEVRSNTSSREPLKLVDHNGVELSRKPADARPGPVVKWKSRGSGVVYTPRTKAQALRHYRTMQWNNVMKNWMHP